MLRKPVFALIFAAAMLPAWGQAAPEAAWVETFAPASAMPGGSVTLQVRVRNIGPRTWETAGEGRVEVMVLLIDATGNPWTEQPRPGRFAYPVPPGGSATATLRLAAPDIPGRYVALVGVTHRRDNKAVPDPLAPARVDIRVAPGGP